MRAGVSAALLVCCITFADCSRKPAWQRAYEKCRERTAQELAALERDAERQDSSFSAPLQQFAAGMVGGVGNAVCEAIRSICEPNPEGRACLEVTRAFGERQG